MCGAEAHGKLAKGTARRWAHPTPDSKALPEHVSDKKKRKEKKAAFAPFLTLSKRATRTPNNLGRLEPLPALGPAGPPQGQVSSLPAANPLTTRGSNQNTHQQPQAQLAPQPTGWQPRVAAQAADPNTIPGMLLRHSESLLNRGQSMPKRASSLPANLQRLLSTNGTDDQRATAQEMPSKCASQARLVLEKCAQIKQAWGRYGYYHPWGGYYPPQGYGYPNR